MTEALTVMEPHQLDRPLTAMDIRAQVNLIQEVMRGVMKRDVHFGTIPGTPKPTLYKPGAEKILSTFRIAVEPVVEDLSNYDEARYRVIVRAVSQASGVYLGSGVGECSSLEEKYKWRKIVHQKEWDATPEDRRRVKYDKDGAETKQVRTNAADMANTVLKMATKRAMIAVTLTVTAASDIFAQDIEDLPEELRHAASDSPAGAPEFPQPQRKSEAAKSTASAPTSRNGSVLHVIETRVAKRGESAKGPWTLYSIKTHDGMEYSTFSDSVYADAQKALDSGAGVHLETKEDSKGKQQITAIHIVEEGPDGE